MKYSTLKRLSIAMCSLIMVLCSEVQSAQDLTNSEIMASNTTKLSYQNEATKLSDDELISSQIIELEESSTSWTSYLFSSIQSAVYNTYKILNYATKNPQKAIIFGLVLTAQLIVVAADCECYCTMLNYNIFPFPIESIGTVSDIHMCVRTCVDDYNSFFNRCW